jgi:hypothetical protein
MCDDAISKPVLHLSAFPPHAIPVPLSKFPHNPFLLTVVESHPRAGGPQKKPNIQATHASMGTLARRLTVNRGSRSEMERVGRTG